MMTAQRTCSKRLIKWEWNRSCGKPARVIEHHAKIAMLHAPKGMQCTLNQSSYKMKQTKGTSS